VTKAQAIARVTKAQAITPSKAQAMTTVTAQAMTTVTAQAITASSIAHMMTAIMNKII
jgi:hypothetical protein